MNELDFKQIEQLACDARYEIFLSMVAEERNIWVLANEKREFLKIHSEDHDIEYLPIWPHKEFTRHHITSSNQKLSPECISVPVFFAKWIVGLESDGLKVGVFPSSGQDIWIMEPSEIKSDLQDKFSNLGM